MQFLQIVFCDLSPSRTTYGMFCADFNHKRMLEQCRALVQTCNFSSLTFYIKFPLPCISYITSRPLHWHSPNHNAFVLARALDVKIRNPVDSA